MMVATALILGLVFLQADDDFVGVQDRFVITVTHASHSHHFLELEPFSLQSSMQHSSTFKQLKYLLKRGQYLCKLCDIA